VIFIPSAPENSKKIILEKEEDKVWTRNTPPFTFPGFS
jgi:hypothetical protein